ncbi:MAG TPA: hypothetical protein VEQ63_03925 [Bryobacteraceae bacterium]|nr:hypothetical protein [Bryobacteraceae bacterium]
MNGIPEGTISVGICETQPLVVAGLKAVLAEGTGFQLLETRSLEEAGREVIASAPQVFILDKALGTPAISEWLTKYRDRVQTKFVIWGPVMTEPEALRFLKFGARGIVR